MASFLEAPKTTDAVELLKFFRQKREGSIKEEPKRGIASKPEVESVDDEDSGIIQMLRDWWLDTEDKVQVAQEEVQQTIANTPMPQLPTADSLLPEEIAALQQMESAFDEPSTDVLTDSIADMDSVAPKATEESAPTTVEDLEYTPQVDLGVLDIPKAAGYKQKDVVSYSYYNKPLVEGGTRGNSRKGGDASEAVQKRAISAIVKAGQDAGMSADDIALTLAIARHESGFNPDAAAGTTSAHGLGQFVNDTGTIYGINDDNRWDLDTQAKALVAHTIDNIKLAESRGKPRSYVYKYHHDGPSKDYGGLATSTKNVMPYVDRFKEMLGVTMTEDTSPEESPRPRLRPAGLMSRDS